MALINIGPCECCGEVECDCTVCFEGTPENYVVQLTISGAADECEMFNGTWELPYNGLFPCRWVGFFEDGGGSDVDFTFQYDLTVFLGDPCTWESSAVATASGLFSLGMTFGYGTLVSPCLGAYPMDVVLFGGSGGDCAGSEGAIATATFEAA